MALSFSAIETFYWVSQLRSFSGAAKQLNVTQPTVSYRIRELEERLGVNLLGRQKRQLILTSEGEALKIYSEAMIAIARDIETNIRTRNTVAPALRVGVIDSFAAVGLPSLLYELDKRFAGSRVAATVDTSYTLAGQLSEGLLDIAVLSTPPAHDNVALELLGRQTVSWVASIKLGLSVNPVLDSELLRQRIFSTPAPSNLHTLTSNALSGNNSVGLRLNVCNSLGAILKLVESGAGISILPTCLVKEQIEHGSLRVLDTGTKLVMQEVFIGTNKGAIIKVLPQVAQMIRRVSIDVGYCSGSS